MKASKTEQAEYIEKLRKLLKPGDTVYTTVKHVSASGMSRSIDVHIIHNNEPQWLSYMVAKALGWSFDENRECVKVGGCGMDIGFHLVYELSRRLFPNGFGIKCSLCGYRTETKDRTNLNFDGVQCLSQEKDEQGYRIVTHAYRGRNGDTSGWDNDGGYALEQRWL